MKWTTSFFRMDSGYENDEIAEVIEEAGYQYVVKVKEYSINMLDKAYGRPVKIWGDYGYQKQVFMMPDQWEQGREICNFQGIKTGRRQENN